MGLITQTHNEYYKGDNYGSYQFINIKEIIDQFRVAYVGEDKIIPKCKSVDIQFHALRALRELSFDTFKSCKGFEFTVPNVLTIPLPQDYVNYVKVSAVDSNGIKRVIYPTKLNSNPTNLYQNSDNEFLIEPIGTLTNGSNTVVLDGDYSARLVNGMKVTGVNLAVNSYIRDIVTTAGITTITLENFSRGTAKNATATTNERLTVTTSSFGVPFPGDETVTTTTASAAAGLNVRTLTLTSVAGINVGDIVNHANIADNTTVESIGTNTVVITTGVLAGLVAINDTITFVSVDTKKSETWENYKSVSNREINLTDENVDGDVYDHLIGNRYGLDPQHAHVSGAYYIDCQSGKIHFSSDLSGRTVILDYISDSLGTDEEMVVHKFAEEAMYKHIAYGIVSTRLGIPEFVVQRFKKEKFTETRKAKLRLSNIKLEEITQILRGKSKQIKH